MKTLGRKCLLGPKELLAVIRSRQSGEWKGSFTGRENMCEGAEVLSLRVAVMRIEDREKSRGYLVKGLDHYLSRIGLHFKPSEQSFQVVSIGTIYQTYPWEYYSGCTEENGWSRKQGGQLGFCNSNSGKNNESLH